MQKDRFHMITNRPEKYYVNDYFFELNDAEVVSVHSEELDTTDGFDVHIGLPTVKYMQGFGYDKDHII